MPALLASLGAWHWLIAGLVLLALELVAPGAFLMWLGLAALAVGALSLAVALPWQAASVVFAVLALVFVAIGRRIAARRTPGAPALNERAAALVGRSFILSERISAGQGRIRVDDSSWGVEGPDLPAGTRVTVTGHDGTRLKVAPAP